VKVPASELKVPAPAASRAEKPRPHSSAAGDTFLTNTPTWQTLKSVYTNKNGEVALSYRFSKTRDYRFSLYSTSISWDLGSAVTRR
jgi:hypothetical protein